jgi:hypothetical protein
LQPECNPDGVAWTGDRRAVATKEDGMTEFFQTVMGRQFFDGTMPRIAEALERIADRMATAEQATATLEQVVAPVDATADRVAELEAALAECLTLAGHIDEPERDEALDKVRAVLERAKPTAPKVDDVAPADGDEWDHAAILNVRRGLKRGAALVRALGEVEVVPGVHRFQQNEILRIAAEFLDGHAVTYGTPSGER